MKPFPSVVCAAGLVAAAAWACQTTPDSSNGQPRLILPTRKRVGTTIEQALCAEPPPPDA